MAKAIPASARRGFRLFNEKAHCSTCHSGWRFTDDSFYDIGVAHDDVGRAKVTPRIDLAHFAFKTPTLRNVAERAPYLTMGRSARSKGSSTATTAAATCSVQACRMKSSDSI